MFLQCKCQCSFCVEKKRNISECSFLDISLSVCLCRRCCFHCAGTAFGFHSFFAHYFMLLLLLLVFWLVCSGLADRPSLECIANNYHCVIFVYASVPIFRCKCSTNNVCIVIPVPYKCSCNKYSVKHHILHTCMPTSLPSYAKQTCICFLFLFDLYWTNLEIYR